MNRIYNGWVVNSLIFLMVGMSLQMGCSKSEGKLQKSANPGDSPKGDVSTLATDSSPNGNSQGGSGIQETQGSDPLIQRPDEIAGSYLVDNCSYEASSKQDNKSTYVCDAQYHDSSVQDDPSLVIEAQGIEVAGVSYVVDFKFLAPSESSSDVGAVLRVEIKPHGKDRFEAEFKYIELLTAFDKEEAAKGKPKKNSQKVKPPKKPKKE
jgi:hypothetical protein